MSPILTRVWCHVLSSLCPAGFCKSSWAFLKKPGQGLRGGVYVSRTICAGTTMNMLAKQLNSFEVFAVEQLLLFWIVSSEHGAKAGRRHSRMLPYIHFSVEWLIVQQLTSAFSPSVGRYQHTAYTQTDTQSTQTHNQLLHVCLGSTLPPITHVCIKILHHCIWEVFRISIDQHLKSSSTFHQSASSEHCGSVKHSGHWNICGNC